jgi:hypothetical protein
MTYMEESNGGDVKIEMEQQTLRINGLGVGADVDFRRREAARGNL